MDYRLRIIQLIELYRVRGGLSSGKTGDILDSIDQPIESMRTVAAYLVQLKEEKGVSYQVIADAIGVSPGTLSYISSGRTEKPAPETLRRIAAYFGGGNAQQAALIYQEFMDRAGYLAALPRLPEGEILERLRRLHPDIYRQVAGNEPEPD
jgi:transcriptional regulator with XRE-family HTH domain